jgi:hypothetical protein
MHLIPPLPDHAQIVFRYLGGPKDGAEVGSEEPADPLAYTAEFLWITTRGGELGARNWVISDYGMRAESASSQHTLVPRHLYVLADRIESPGEILFLLTHQGTDIREWA